VTQLAEHIGRTTPRRKAKEDKTPTMLTPPELANRMGVSPDAVLGWIRSGELAATNVAKPTSTRPRYKISEEAVREFEKKRQAEKPAPAPRRRKGKDPGVTEFF
jgi:excisionase family DNA binding protein